MGIDGSIAGWAFWLFLAVIGVRYVHGIVKFGAIQDKHLRDPNRRPFWTQSLNSDYWSEEGRQWQKDGQRFSRQTAIVLVVTFLILDFFT